MFPKLLLPKTRTSSFSLSHPFSFNPLQYFFFPLNRVFLCGSGCPRTLCRPCWPQVERSAGLCLQVSGLQEGYSMCLSFLCAPDKISRTCIQNKTFRDFVLTL